MQDAAITRHGCCKLALGDNHFLMDAALPMMATDDERTTKRG